MENALAVIDRAKTSGALVYSAPHLDTAALYRAEATVIGARPDEFTDIGGGRFMPAKAVVDRISDAAGIDFIAAEEGVKTEIREDETLGRRTVFIGRCQGKVRLSDGSWRSSSVEEYEFDPYVRAALDAKGDKAKEIRLRLEYQKFPRQRAATGARLRAIKQLTGMPTAFTRPEVDRIVGHGAAFSRIVQNNDYILGTKEGRSMAIAQATGVAGMLYGNQRPAALIEPEARDITSESSASVKAAPAGIVPDEPGADDFALITPKEEVPAMAPAVIEYRQALTDWANHENKDIARIAEATLGRDETDPDILEVTVAGLKYVAGRGANPKGAEYCIGILTNTPRDKIILGNLLKKVRGATEGQSAKESS